MRAQGLVPTSTHGSAADFNIDEESQSLRPPIAPDKTMRAFQRTRWSSLDTAQGPMSVIWNFPRGGSLPLSLFSRRQVLGSLLDPRRHRSIGSRCGLLNAWLYGTRWCPRSHKYTGQDKFVTVFTDRIPPRYGLLQWRKRDGRRAPHAVSPRLSGQVSVASRRLGTTPTISDLEKKKKPKEGMGRLGRAIRPRQDEKEQGAFWAERKVRPT